MLGLKGHLMELENERVKSPLCIGIIFQFDSAHAHQRILFLGFKRQLEVSARDSVVLIGRC